MVYAAVQIQEKPRAVSELLVCVAHSQLVPRSQENKTCWFPSDINQIYNLSSTVKPFHETKQKTNNRKQHSVQMLEA